MHDGSTRMPLEIWKSARANGATRSEIVQPVITAVSTRVQHEPALWMRGKVPWAVAPARHGPVRQLPANRWPGFTTTGVYWESTPLPR